MVNEDLELTLKVRGWSAGLITFMKHFVQHSITSAETVTTGAVLIYISNSYY